MGLLHDQQHIQLDWRRRACISCSLPSQHLTYRVDNLGQVPGVQRVPGEGGEIPPQAWDAAKWRLESTGEGQEDYRQSYGGDRDGRGKARGGDMIFVVRSRDHGWAVCYWKKHSNFPPKVLCGQGDLLSRCHLLSSYLKTIKSAKITHSHHVNRNHGCQAVDPSKFLSISIAVGRYLRGTSRKPYSRTA